MGKADERLLALWHTLDSTELGLTKQEIRRTVPGYDEAATGLAFEKMFTRDKNALRELGTVLEIRDGGLGSERYRLVASTGPAVDLTLAEAAATRLAASFWAAGDLGAEADVAARRFTGDIPMGGSLVAHVPTTGALIKPLLNAIGARRRVKFSYRSGVSGKTAQRVVEPWRVAFRDGGWYLLGADVDRGGSRAFRLSRIVGDIKTVSGPGAYHAPAEVDVADLLGETSHTIAAIIALAPGRGARLRTLGTVISDDDDGYVVPPGFTLIKYRYDDEREFADELAGLGAGVVVYAPAQLRAAVISRLRSAARLGDGLKLSGDHE
ncbi:MAG: WYL domain-containing protein [Promicromonosporaceae bacterium]|nr:WYL domain-containing protein [Promicromonosporaceae bacterium]